MKTEHPGGAPRHVAFPMTFVTRGKGLLIIGGGRDTTQRVSHALRFDWQAVDVVAEAVAAEWREAAQGDARVQFHERPPCESDVRGADLVIEDLHDRSRAAVIAGWCQAHKVPLNSTDKADLCDWYYMSFFERGPMLVAVASGGHTPALVPVFRRRLEQQVGRGWQTAACQMAALRARLPGGQARMELLKGLARDDRLLALIEQNDTAGIQQFIDHATRSLRT